jgi:hypothetical protein
MRALSANPLLRPPPSVNSLKAHRVWRRGGERKRRPRTDTVLVFSNSDSIAGGWQLCGNAPGNTFFGSLCAGTGDP